jgi:hypothetical protein
LHVLVTKGIAKVESEFDTLLNDDSWFEQLGAGSLPLMDFALASEIAVALVLRNAAAFHRRFVKPLQKFPFRLFWMLESPAEVRCSTRIEVSTAFLNTSSLDDASRKLKLIFLQDSRTHSTRCQARRCCKNTHIVISVFKPCFFSYIFFGAVLLFQWYILPH